MLSDSKIQALVEKAPLLSEIMDLKPLVWINPNEKKMAVMPKFPFAQRDIYEAETLWTRFAPFLAKAFPEELASTKGFVESPLTEVPRMKEALEKMGENFKGRLFIKCDHSLPVAGSIKARGGFFEVLSYAEKLALKAGLIKEGDNYVIFDSEEFKQFFSQYKIGVGSTGNLGLSIGIISARLGFEVNVYVSADAKAWKKQLLREKGANVLEFDGDFSEAILAGRQTTKADPKGYFVDDENSHQLYLGYSVGALRLSRQLEELGIVIDADHPLFVYSPCGVGGSPGGTAFGLKEIYGDNVHIFFVEPTHSPAVITGLLTGEMSNICVQDIGIDNKTEADGLAVGRPSNFATSISNHIISGCYTIEDEHLYELLTILMDSENIFLEPSATAGLIGPQMVAQSDYIQSLGLNMENAIHIAWSTGGDLVPEVERKQFYQRGEKALALR